MTRQATIWPLPSPSHGLAEVPLRDWPAVEAYADSYICDVLLPVQKIAIEVYGGVHVLHQVRDHCRKQALQAHGLRVLEFSNDESMNNMRRAIVAFPREA